MATIFKITCAGNQVDFLGDPAYRVTRWEPTVAKRRAANLGGRGPYEDVVEEMTLFIGGATALDKLAWLQKLMDQVDAWSRNEFWQPTLLHFQASASSPELKTTLLGPAAPGEPIITLPPNFSLAANIGAIDPVILRFRRIGWWLAADNSKNSSSVAHPAAATISGLTQVDVASPVVLKVNSIYSSASGLSGFLLMARSGNFLRVVEAETLASGLDWTSVNDSANKAKGNNVLRFTPPDLFTNYSVYVTPSLDSNNARWGVFINYRNNSATTSFRLRARFTDYGSVTPWTIIPAGVSIPQWIYLGSTLLTSTALLRFQLECVASAASGSIDFDSIVILGLDSPETGQATAIRGNVPMGTASIVADHRLLSRSFPIVYFDTAASPHDYQGDATFVKGAIPATSLVAAWLSCSGGLATSWVPTNAGGNPISSTFTAVQSPGYLIPE